MIEEVPANDPGAMLEKHEKGGYESMDSTEMAETRILAKKMLRKKARRYFRVNNTKVEGNIKYVQVPMDEMIRYV